MLYDGYNIRLQGGIPITMKALVGEYVSSYISCGATVLNHAENLQLVDHGPIPPYKKMYSY